MDPGSGPAMMKGAESAYGPQLHSGGAVHPLHFWGLSCVKFV